MKNKKNLCIYFVVIMIGVIIDLVSKSMIAMNMQLHDSIELIPNFFYLTYYHNEGAAWGILQGQQGLFMIITIAALIIMGYYLFTLDQKDTFSKMGLLLMISGTIGNFYDRICFGYVRDFLDFYIFAYDFPIFNIADSLLCVGVALLVVAVFIDEKKKGNI